MGHDKEESLPPYSGGAENIPRPPASGVSGRIFAAWASNAGTRDWLSLTFGCGAGSGGYESPSTHYF